MNDADKEIIASLTELLQRLSVAPNPPSSVTPKRSGRNIMFRVIVFIRSDPFVVHRENGEYALDNPGPGAVFPNSDIEGILNYLDDNYNNYRVELIQV